MSANAILVTNTGHANVGPSESAQTKPTLLIGRNTCAAQVFFAAKSQDLSQQTMPNAGDTHVNGSALQHSTGRL